MTVIKHNHDVKRSILYSLIKFSFRINLLRSFQFNEEIENSSLYFFLLYFCLHFSCLFVKFKEIWKTTIYITENKKKNLNRRSSLFNEHLRIFLVKYFIFLPVSFFNIAVVVDNCPKICPNMQTWTFQFDRPTLASVYAKVTIQSLSVIHDVTVKPFDHSALINTKHH